MTFFQKTYLYKLWKHSKWIFVLVMIFIAGQLFLTHKGIQNFPFYHWGVFSGPYPAKESYTVYEVYLDDQRLDKHSRITTMRDDWYILLQRFDRINAIERNVENILDSRLKSRISSQKLDFVKNQIMNDQNINESFPIWFDRYVSQALNQSYDSISVYKSKYQYDLEIELMNRISTEKMF